MPLTPYNNPNFSKRTKQRAKAGPSPMAAIIEQNKELREENAALKTEQPTEKPKRRRRKKSENRDAE